MSKPVSSKELEGHVDALLRRIAEQETRIAQLEGASWSDAEPRRASEPWGRGKGVTRAGDGGERTLDRRRLLAGSAVAAVGGVGALLATADPAAAADGELLYLGQATTMNATATQINAKVSGSAALNIMNYDTNTAGDGGAVYGMSGGSSGLTIDGAILGDTNLSNGVAGATIGGSGVYGISVNGPGVYGISNLGDAVVGNTQSASGSDLAAVGNGRIYATPQGGPGAPTDSATTFRLGDQVRDSAGQMWICIAGGSPGAWQKVAAVAPGANGGSVNLLASPFRLYDSRAGQPAAITTPQQQLQPGSAGALTLSATSYGGVAGGAIGIIGTLTITNTRGAGYLALYPADTAAPPTSNINATGVGQTVAASYTCGLSSGGNVTIYNGGAPTDVILDIAGYIY